MKLNARINVPGIAVILLVVAVWQVSTATFLRFEYLPSPIGIAEAFAEMVAGGEILLYVGHTLSITLLAAAIAIAGGVILGSVIALAPFVRTYTLGTVNVLRSLPVVALMPIALLIWGPEPKTELIVAVFSALWPITINSIGGVAQIHPRLLEMARTFRLSTGDTFRKVVFPAALPSILVGSRLAVIHALVVVIVAEMLINPQGMGGRLYRTQVALQPEQMWVWVIISGIIGYLLNVIMIRGVRKALPGIGSAIGGAS
ncbi:ABC transporter permease [Arthrobacter sulfonylureivorans]|uniref:ABC transporter permease subunit n=1 Tax=Arthrobacter sulfonylureivorans TaxID=2486855 RepID=A0ABY3WBE8_9MICC|nr:ABC transporter permease subunit [Arthrobacter sulfonylureivorans]UNK45632.1 ABC transporter permease subunit [Arthrobacter sulfonylureivorans]